MIPSLTFGKRKSKLTVSVGKGGNKVRITGTALLSPHDVRGFAVELQRFALTLEREQTDDAALPAPVEGGDNG